MKKILLFSFSNSNNIGDRAISKVFFELLGERYDVTRCSNEGNFEIADRYVSENIAVSERIKHKLCELFGRRYMTPRYKAFLEEYRKRVGDFDAVVIGGGNIMMDYTKKSASFEKYSDYITIAKENGVPTFVFSAGIGPFRTERQAKGAAAALNGCEYVSFRDESSLSLFKENGGNAENAAISRDPVFLLEGRGAAQKRNVVALNVIDPSWDGGVDRGALEIGYTKLARALAEEYPKKEIVLFSTEKNDEALAKKIARDTSGAARYFEIGSLDELIAFYSRCSLLVGARMHSMIIAFTQKTPIIALSWSRKTDEFCSFANIGKAHKIAELADEIPEILEEADEKADTTASNDGAINAAREAILKDIGRLG